ncbi:MAG: nitrogenase molybdenum-iron protein alpha chain [Firmicutes bacterium HGW-Firmicutes-15]|nr:MAG: nitrogenase molybdenum-iron protein alpha chain [Firmicutes bacterium HGW-Firmicutes-15]
MGSVKEMVSITERKNMANKVLTGERAISSLMMDMPGMVCKHGCSYVACRGLVLTPISGILIITHGPVGCSYYSWGGNRLRHQAANAQHDYFSNSFSTHMDESDIIFGGEKKLKQAIKEAVEIFRPPVIAICSTCPIGLIGDDVQSIAEAAEKEYGVKVISFSCEGFRSIPGYRIANMGIIENVIGTGQNNVGKYPVNIIGEFYNGQRAKEIARIFKHIGYDIVAVLMGDGNYDDLKNAHQAKLNLFNSDKVVADLVEVMQDKFGTDWMGFNFIGLDNIINSLKNMADFFGTPELLSKTEDLIADELAKIQDSMDDYKMKLKNRIAVIQEDEFVSRHYQALFSDLDVNPVMVGNELFCRPGQNEMSFMSAVERGCSTPDTKLGVRYDTDLEHYHINLPVRLYEQIKTKTTINDTNGVHSKMAYDSILIPNLTHGETEQLLNTIQPDIYFPGIKENFAGVGTGYRSCFFNADDYRFDYGGFRGAIHFAQDLLMAINMSVWQNNVAPWKIDQ